MRFSEAFGITRRRADDWFDPHPSVDTKLFVDPLLILLTEKQAGPTLMTTDLSLCPLLQTGGSSNQYPVHKRDCSSSFLDLSRTGRIALDLQPRVSGVPVPGRSSRDAWQTGLQ